VFALQLGVGRPDRSVVHDDAVVQHHRLALDDRLVVVLVFLAAVGHHAGVARDHERLTGRIGRPGASHEIGVRVAAQEVGCHSRLLVHEEAVLQQAQHAGCVLAAGLRMLEELACQALKLLVRQLVAGAGDDAENATHG
jgi:hypothetical protein